MYKVKVSIHTDDQAIALDAQHAFCMAQLKIYSLPISPLIRRGHKEGISLVVT